MKDDEEMIEIFPHADKLEATSTTLNQVLS
jgi:hypothetical protein